MDYSLLNWIYVVREVSSYQCRLTLDWKNALEDPYWKAETDHLQIALVIRLHSWYLSTGIFLVGKSQWAEAYKLCAAHLGQVSFEYRLVKI